MRTFLTLLILVLAHILLLTQPPVVPAVTVPDGNLSFPVRIHDAESGGTVDLELIVEAQSSDVDVQILLFCEENKIQEAFCRMLNDAVVKAIDERAVLAPSLPNAHLIRHDAAILAERKRLFQMGGYDFGSIAAAEESAIEVILDRWGETVVRRAAVVHSCVLTADTVAGTLILRDMLQQVRDYGLADALDSIVVLNYGYPLPAHLTAAYEGTVIFVQVSESVVFFEVPTLRVLHRLSQYLNRQPSHQSSQQSSSPHTAGSAQVLYLHTKGTSYQLDYPQIQDWRDMMLYFGAGRHAAVSHLLQSGEVDCVGVNFKSHPRPILSGNFWWSTAAHLAALPDLPHRSSGKYEAETWLLGRAGVRVYVMHSSNINHAVSTYPPLCYAEEAHGVEPRTRPHHAEVSNHPLQRVDELCGGARTVREARRFWQLL